jgi:hypothetical protein
LAEEVAEVAVVDADADGPVFEMLECESSPSPSSSSSSRFLLTAVLTAVEDAADDADADADEACGDEACGWADEEDADEACGCGWADEEDTDEACGCGWADDDADEGCGWADDEGWEARSALSAKRTLSTRSLNLVPLSATPMIGVFLASELKPMSLTDLPWSSTVRPKSEPRSPYLEGPHASHCARSASVSPMASLMRLTGKLIGLPSDRRLHCTAYFGHGL